MSLKQIVPSKKLVNHALFAGKSHKFVGIKIGDENTDIAFIETYLFDNVMVKIHTHKNGDWNAFVMASANEDYQKLDATLKLIEAADKIFDETKNFEMATFMQDQGFEIVETGGGLRQYRQTLENSTIICVTDKHGDLPTYGDKYMLGYYTDETSMCEGETVEPLKIFKSTDDLIDHIDDIKKRNR